MWIVTIVLIPVLNCIIRIHTLGVFCDSMMNMRVTCTTE